MIEIEAIDEKTFRVTVNASSKTTHMVTIDPSYHRRLTGGNADVETLLRKSFEFLLQRESNTSILSRFELPVISRYFPEYERTIKSMLS